MTHAEGGGGFVADDVDFETLYQGKPAFKGSELVFEVPPWDIGEPQPEVVALADGDALRSEVLDVGCGLGDNAIFLARRGFRVTGADGSPTALDKARQRAAAAGVDVGFVRTDATRLTEFADGRFASVLDSALYHCLSEEQQREYAAASHRVTAPGAVLRLFCFADVPSPGFPQPNPISTANLRENLGPHWDIRDITLVRYSTALSPELVAAAYPDAEIGEPVLDERGRVTMPVWHLHAVRR